MDESGFLLDPEHDLLRHANPAATRLSALRDVGCLVLLGEAGLGKSTDLEAESRAITASGELVVAVDLGQVGCDESLVRQVFGDPRWNAWRAAARVRMLLDAFDECRASLNNVAQVLLRELARLGTRERLRLRIASRPGAWPQFLENGLEQFRPGSVEVYQLAPLRRRDAIAIAEHCGVGNAAALLEAATRSEAGPLAASPLTLRLLARIQRKHGALPPGRWELYEQGCLALCTEKNPSRWAAGLHGSLSPLQRLTIAGRLAALTLLCGKNGVWAGPDSDCPEPEWLTLSEATGGAERANGLPFTVTEAAVRELICDTALFGTTAPDQVVWSHRSYAEHLAARYLLERNVPARQLRNLLWHPAGRNRIVPQLTALVGRLAPRCDLLQLVRETDPQALSAMDLAECDDAERARVVDAVLKAADSGRLNEHGFGPVQFRRLAHPGLADQLRPVIRDGERAAEARLMALDLGRTCCAAQLQEDLVQLALDPDDALDVRCLAASTVSRLENAPVRSGLRPLLDRDLNEDVNDDLRGCALRATWPDSLAPDELFNRLTPFKRPAYLGAYWSFLHHHLLPNLKDEDLTIALRWVTDLPPELSRHVEFRDLCDKVLLRVWYCGDFAAVAPDLARAVRARIQRRERRLGGDGGDLFGADEARRRLLLAALLPLVPGDRIQARQVFTFRPRLVHESDVPWLFGQLHPARDSTLRQTLSEILIAWHDPGDVARLQRFLEAARKHAEMRDRLAPYVRPVELGSEEAQRMRRAYEEVQAELREAAEHDAKRLLDPSPRERVLRVLERAEAGHPNEWPRITMELTLTPASRTYGSWLDSDLAAAPGWEEADEPTRRRLLAAAEAFLRQSSPRSEDWLDGDGRPDRGLQGYAAVARRGRHDL